MKDRIRKIRKDLNMTQTEFGDSIGVTFAALSKYELGKVIPDKSVRMLICEKYNVSVNWLETGEGEPYVRGLIPQLVHALRNSPALLSMLEQTVNVMDDQDWKNLDAIVEKTLEAYKNTPEP